MIRVESASAPSVPSGLNLVGSSLRNCRWRKCSDAMKAISTKTSADWSELRSLVAVGSVRVDAGIVPSTQS